MKPQTSIFIIVKMYNVNNKIKPLTIVNPDDLIAYLQITEESTFPNK